MPKSIVNKTNKTNQKILLYDIETSYTKAAVWGLYDQNVAGVIAEPYMITFACKWLGESKVQVYSLPMFPLTYTKNAKNDEALVKKLHELFDEADIIVAHNGNSFDQKWANARFLVHGFKPPSPAKYIDTKLVAKRYFRFNSNSLNNLGKYLGCGQKLDTGGIDLWIDCIEHDIQAAWDKMCKYNKQDVVLLEQVYLKLRPWMTSYPEHGITCRCGSEVVIKRGWAKLKGNFRAQRYQCECGAWSQGKKEKK